MRKTDCAGLVRLGKGSVVDPSAIVGYRPGRKVKSLALSIGCRSNIRAGSIIYLGSEIGPGLETGHNVVIREENVIGRGLRIWNNSVVDYGCRIGRDVKIHSNVYVAQFTTIEDGCFLAPGVTIANDLHPGCRESARCMRGPVIRKGAQIGVNATILPFVTIGRRALVGSGAVVVHNVPDGAVVVGNPARVV
ncbi:MAG: N-acetyltransferase, partial [Planctomycetota bacterium]|nr:N-acetyltransferase [Planctomycetota bacterium]